MTVRVGINGFGRIGRNFFRARPGARRRHRDRRRQRPDRQQDAGPPAEVRQHPRPAADEVSVRRRDIIVGGKTIRVLAERDPGALPWGDLGADVVIESTGFFTDADQGARRTSTAAPRRSSSRRRPRTRTSRSSSASTTRRTTRPSTTIISNASCTTNCLAPMAKVAADELGIERGLMTTIHAYTQDQNLQDGPHKDLRRARAAALNIVPDHHRRGQGDRPGAARAQGQARRLRAAGAGPDRLGHRPDRRRSAARPRSTRSTRRQGGGRGPAQGLSCSYTEDPIVSSDIVTDPASCIFDAGLTKVIGNQVKVVGWYDNEWGYSNRLVDLVTLVGQTPLSDGARADPGDIASLGDLRGKRVLVRSDLNVPLDGTTDHRRRPDPGLRADHLQRSPSAGARVVVCAHLGRPKGAPDEKYSLRPGRRRGSPSCSAGRSTFATDTVGESAQAAVAGLGDGDVALLENLRFNAGETSKDDAERGEFADAARRRSPTRTSTTGSAPCTASTPASTTSPPRLPHAAGDLVRTEVEVLKRLTGDPERPYVVVLGGSKVSDKLGVIDNLLTKVDRLLIGGGMCFTFLEAQGHEVGKSLLEEDQVDTVPGLPRAGRGERRRDRAAGRRRRAAAEFAADAETATVAADAIPADRHGPGHRPEVGRAVRRRRSPTPARSSGTARWASSRWRRSPPAPAGRRRRSSRSPRRAGSPSSAAATRPPPCASSASTRTRSATSPPAAAPPWSTSRARSCPASPSWRTQPTVT